MRKFLTTGLFGAILGIVIGGAPADASLISRSFLDQALTSYATTTALDLKANQSDFTDLNTQISDSIDNLKTLWNSDIGILADGFDPNKVNNDINGAFGLVEGFIVHSMQSLTNGWTSDVGIGVRFDNYYEYNPGLKGMFNGWTIYNPSGSEIMVYKGLENISSQIRTIEDTYHTNLSKLLVNGENKINIEAYNYTGPIYPIWKLTQLVALPEGTIDIGGGGLSEMFGKEKSFPVTIPSDYTLSDAFQNLFYSAGVFPSFVDIAEYTMYGGTLSSYWESFHGIKTYKGLLELTKDIGTLPSGRLHMRLPDLSIFASAGITEPFNYPTSLSDLFLYLFGSDEDTTKNGLFPVIGTRLGYISAQIDNIKNTSNAIQSKIGTVPDGYETVGAALTAIKGIAEDAKAAALAAIPDPKTEGSTGKYVLTVDIVGDNATYRWEKIDREGETTTTE